MSKCPFTRKNCMQFDCKFWQQYRGMNPMTGQEEDKWECCIVMENVMLVEVARQLRSVSAAAESQRNVVASKLDALVSSRMALEG